MTNRRRRHDRPRLNKVSPSAEIYIAPLGWPDTENMESGLTLFSHEIGWIWSYIDAELAALMNSFLRADFEVVADVYAALRSARVPALMAAAKSVLSPERKTLFNRAMKAIASAREDTRDVYAHHLAVHSPDVTDCLLLLNPRVYAKYLASERAVVERTKARHVPDAHLLPADRVQALVDAALVQEGTALPFPTARDIEVFTLDDVQTDIFISRTALLAARTLYGAVADGPSAAQERTELSNLLEVLRTLRNPLIETPSEPPPEQPPEGPTLVR